MFVKPDELSSRPAHVTRVYLLQAASRASLAEPIRPQPDDDVGVRHNVKHRFFPELVDQIPPVKA